MASSVMASSTGVGAPGGADSAGEGGGSAPNGSPPPSEVEVTVGIITPSTVKTKKFPSGNFDFGFGMLLETNCTSGDTVIKAVADNSTAKSMGLKKGMVIVYVNREIINAIHRNVGDLLKRPVESGQSLTTIVASTAVTLSALQLHSLQVEMDGAGRNLEIAGARDDILSTTNLDVGMTIESVNGSVPNSKDGWVQLVRGSPTEELLLKATREVTVTVDDAAYLKRTVSSDGSVKIGKIDNDSPLLHRGLKKGLTIESVNGNPCSWTESQLLRSHEFCVTRLTDAASSGGVEIIVKWPPNPIAPGTEGAQQNGPPTSATTTSTNDHEGSGQNLRAEASASIHPPSAGESSTPATGETHLPAKAAAPSSQNAVDEEADVSSEQNPPANKSSRKQLSDVSQIDAGESYHHSMNQSSESSKKGASAAATGTGAPSQPGPIYVEETAWRLYNSASSPGSSEGQVTSEQKGSAPEQLSPLPPAPPLPNQLPSTGHCNWTFDEETRVLLADFRNSSRAKAEGRVTVVPEDEAFLLRMMERDDISVVSEGLADGINPLLLSRQYIEGCIGSDYHHLFRCFETTPSQTQAIAKEKKGWYSMKVADYFKYLDQRRAVRSGSSTSRADETSFTFINDKGEGKSINAAEEAIYMVDVDMPKLLPRSFADFQRNFKLPSVLPGGSHCMMNSVNSLGRPFMGPNLYLTPPGASTHFHQDGHGTTDSGHLCLSGYNEVIMLRRLTERHKCHALQLLTGGKVDPRGILYGLPHRDGEKSQPAWPSKEAIEKCKEMGYCPSVFILKPGQMVHINKGRLHAFGKFTGVLTPKGECPTEDMFFSVAWDWMFKGVTSEGINREVASVLECATLNREHNVESLGIPETALLFLAKENIAIAECLAASTPDTLISPGLGLRDQSTHRSSSPGAETVLRGILPSLQCVVTKHSSVVKRSQKQSESYEDSSDSSTHSEPDATKPDAWDDPAVAAINPYGVDDYQCKICAEELSNVYMHCNGCETLLKKDFNICTTCHSEKKHRIFVQMHPLCNKMLSLHNHTGSMAESEKRNCCEVACKNCKFCAGCSCKCHQDFKLCFRFMDVKDELGLLRQAEGIVGSNEVKHASETRNRLLALDFSPGDSEPYPPNKKRQSKGTRNWSAWRKEVVASGRSRGEPDTEEDDSSSEDDSSGCSANQEEPARENAGEAERVDKASLEDAARVALSHKRSAASNERKRKAAPETVGTASNESNEGESEPEPHNKKRRNKNSEKTNRKRKVAPKLVGTVSDKSNTDGRLPRVAKKNVQYGDPSSDEEDAQDNSMDESNRVAHECTALDGTGPKDGRECGRNSMEQICAEERHYRETLTPLVESLGREDRRFKLPLDGLDNALDCRLAGGVQLLVRSLWGGAKDDEQRGILAFLSGFEHGKLKDGTTYGEHFALVLYGKEGDILAVCVVLLPTPSTGGEGRGANLESHVAFADGEYAPALLEFLMTAKKKNRKRGVGTFLVQMVSVLYRLHCRCASSKIAAAVAEGADGFYSNLGFFAQKTTDPTNHPNEFRWWKAQMPPVFARGVLYGHVYEGPDESWISTPLATLRVFPQGAEKRRWASSSTTAGANRRREPKQRRKKQSSSPNRLQDDPGLAPLLAQARYESRVDPYRGLAPHTSSHGGDMPPEELTSAHSPWGKCAAVLEADARWGFNSGVEVVNVNGDNEDLCEEAALAVECGCPTVDRWAADELAAWQKAEAAKKKEKKKGKKRERKKSNADEEGEDVVFAIDSEGEGSAAGEAKGPRLFCGERQGGHAPSCPCDYNPFCLASAGGMVDRHRQSAAKIKHTAREATPSNISQQMIRDNLEGTLATLQNAENGNDADSGTLRRSIVIDVDSLVGHAVAFLGDGDKVDAIQSMQERLTFDAENNGETAVPKGEMKLSTPPGLRNLGATCYLNSQLQCLAQNLGFAHGLFLWRKPPFDTGSEVEKRMATVLSHMQNILARMRYGPDRVICTNEFAVALSLENNEMQDPNEFARLLFGRMQESFRQSAAISPESLQSGLGELLQSVFGGTFANVTECLECGKKSERKEDFMDLTVPIIDAEEESDEQPRSGEESDEQPRKGKRAKKASVGDTDVQQRLNKYLHAESLTGDNKYECSRCGKKCDATRRVILAKLPPVLNIQLARYVFDKGNFAKQKLSTKVLLPKSLEIPAKSTYEGVQQREYMLCAVQNHLGNSAQRGHYVADVMDWTTGVWYEFNDKKATVLEHGPTSSFEPIERDDEVSGSEDAYNLFYVDKQYLAEQCEWELQKFSENSGEQCDILADMAVQRDGRYRLEREKQEKEMLKIARMQLRQKLMLEKLFHPAPNLAVAPDSEGKKVWIDGHFLRRFFSCHDGLDDVFQNPSASFLKSEPFSCEHQKLAPRSARQGKLLRSDVYDAMEVIVRTEYAQFLTDQDNDLFLDPDSVNLMDQKFVSDDENNFACKECGMMYQHEARRKLELFELLVSIHDDLLPGENDIDKRDIDKRNISDPSGIYVISRAFATSLRSYVEKKVKELKSMAQTKSLDKTKNDAFCGGLDTLDLSEVLLPVRDEEKQESENSTEASDTAEVPGLLKGKDPTSKITCKHNRCPAMNTGNSVRLIPAEIWRKLAKVFPNAVPHQFDHPRANAVGNCVQCYREKEETNILLRGLKEWKGKITQPGPLRHLRARGGRQGQLYPSETMDILLQTPGSGGVSLHALHHLDVIRWREAFAAVERHLKSKKKETVDIKSQLNELLFAGPEESQGREWKIRSLVCNEHNMALCLPPLSGEGDAKIWLGMLNEANVEMLLEVEYRELMSSLSSLESIIHGSGSDPREIGAPTVSIRCQQGKLAIKIDPQLCSSGCQASFFEDECMEDGKILSISQQAKQSKPAKDREPVVEASKGPLCRALVHEIESNVDPTVAADMIRVDVENDNEPQSSTGRPRRSRKAKGGSEGGFPSFEIDMALDGNLAHLRLLLLAKGKALVGQRLYMLHTSTPDQQVRELGDDCNPKTLQEIITRARPSGDASGSDVQGDYQIRLILSYRDTAGRSEREMRLAARGKEAHDLVASLTSMQSLGWKDRDGSEASKMARSTTQERGFRDTLLDSAWPKSRGNGSGEATQGAAEAPRPVQEAHSNAAATSNDEEKQRQMGAIPRSETRPASTQPMTFELESGAQIESDPSYDQILNLCKKVGVVIPDPVTEAAIDDRFPSRRMMEEGGNCIICSQKQQTGDTVRELQCGHTFHQHCIDRKLCGEEGAEAKSLKKATCPLCNELCFFWA